MEYQGVYPPNPHNTTPEYQYFARGKEILGNKAGGLLVKLLRSKQGNVALARAAIETASTKHNPAEYIGAILRGPIQNQERAMIGGGYA